MATWRKFVKFRISRIGEMRKFEVKTFISPAKFRHFVYTFRLLVYGDVERIVLVKVGVRLHGCQPKKNYEKIVIIVSKNVIDHYYPGKIRR